jgi:hypothetical protein
MLLPVFAGFAGAKDYTTESFENPEAKLENMIVAAVSEDGNLMLYFDEFSGELAVKNVSTGEILLSNPYNVTEKIADKALREQYLSQIYLNYRKIGSSATSTYYSYTDCVNYNQMKIVEHKTNGIVVEYTLGDSRTELLVPLKMTVEDYEALYNKLSYDAKRYFNLHYEKIDPYGTDKYGNPYLPEIQENWLKQYPISATTPLYVIKSASLKSPSTVQNIINYIEKQTDYTYEQLLIDYEKVKEDTDTFTTGEKAHFTFKVTYTVDNDGFSAELDAGTLQYNKEEYYIESIALLPYLAAANRNDTGYTFVPDGSGALVRFEDIVAKNKRDTLTVPLYGTDFALYQISERNQEARTMPVFGMINTSGAYAKGFFAIIEDGETIATVLSTHSDQYHLAYATFKLTATDTYDLADALSSGVSSSKLVGVKADPDDYYEGKCKIKFAVLSDHEDSASKEASYVGMAKYYREYLNSKNDISKLEDEDLDSFTRIFLEVFGAIDVEEKFLTFPVKSNKPLTTFDDVKTIHKDLSDGGVGNMTFILKGFANGGLASKYPTYVKWQKKLGGADGMNSLLSYMEGLSDGSIVAPEFDFTYSQSLKSFSGFKYKNTGVKTLDNRYSTKRQYNAATQTFERTGGVAISSGSFALAFEKFYDDISEYNVTHLMLSTLGSDINSDFDKKGDFYDREASKDNITSLLGKFDEKNYGIILNAGNSFTLKYTESIVGASLDSSRFNIQSEAVPFYGMVLHGSIEFAGNAINMDGDKDYMFLKALENGASLYFTLAYKDGEYLKFDKTYNKYYSLNYEQLRDDIINMYSEYNGIMSDKQNKVIISHKFMNAEYGYNVSRKELTTGDMVAINDSSVTFVLYGENDNETTGTGFILNYNAFRAYIVDSNGNQIVVEPFSYVEVNSNVNATEFTVVSR